MTSNCKINVPPGLAIVQCAYGAACAEGVHNCLFNHVQVVGKAVQSVSAVLPRFHCFVHVTAQWHTHTTEVC
jgi:hypothetical protein